MLRGEHPHHRLKPPYHHKLSKIPIPYFFQPATCRYGSIVLYTGNSIYRQLNLALRQFHQDVPQVAMYTSPHF